MTENEAIKNINALNAVCLQKDFYDEEFARTLTTAIQALEEIQQYRAIGTIEEFKALKEKSTPNELAEHNFQDEVHHYLCPSCRNIVSCTQNYCEECGQALEV